MGQDISVLFERQKDEGRYELLFPRVPHEEWSHYLPHAFYKDGRGALLSGSDERDVAMRAVDEYLAKMTPEQGAERYGEHPEFWWDYPLPNFPGLPDYKRFERRDHHFFIIVEDMTPERGLPDDASSEAHDWMRANEYCYGSVCVEALLRRLVFKDACLWHQKWLSSFIPEPDRTRMLFSFSY